MSAVPIMRLRCPSCSCLIYSRRPKTCGHCGATLPPEMVLTDDQVRSRHDQREWARRLANVLGSRNPSADNTADSSFSREDDASLPSSDACPGKRYFVEEFKNRKRTGFWLYVIGYTVPLVAMAFLFGSMGVSMTAWLPFVGLTVVSCCSAWWRAAPICPNCHENIRFCPSQYCHICGKALNGKGCSQCGVDYGWTGWFRPYENGLNKRVKYCPGCSVQIDSWVSRGRCRI